MSQQFQQPQPTAQGQQYSPQYGQQHGQQQQQSGGIGQQSGGIGQQGGQRFEQSVPSEIRMTVERLEKVSTVAEWAKTQATQRGLHEVARASDDIIDLAEVQKKLVLRQSPIAASIGQCVVQGFQQHFQELQQYVQDPTVQAELQEAQQTVQTLQGSLQQLQQIGQQSQQGGMQGQQGGMQSQRGGQSRMGQQSFQSGGGQQF